MQTDDDIARWDWDLETDDIVASASMLRLFGLDPAGDPGRDDAWFEFIHPDDRARLKAAEQASLAGAVHDVTYRIVRADGRTVLVRETGVIERDEAGRAVRMRGFMIPIPAIDRP